jgi:peptide/nickel transport system substrate-binding protein
LEALREQWFAATDEPARKAICRDMQLQAFQDVPYVPSGRWTSPTAYRRGLTGVSRYIPIFYNVKWT